MGLNLLCFVGGLIYRVHLPTLVHLSSDSNRDVGPRTRTERNSDSALVRAMIRVRVYPTSNPFLVGNFISLVISTFRVLCDDCAWTAEVNWNLWSMPVESFVDDILCMLNSFSNSCITDSLRSNQSYDKSTAYLIAGRELIPESGQVDSVRRRFA